MSPRKSSIDRRLVLFCGCLINLVLAGPSGLSVLFRPLTAATGWSLSSVALSVTIYNVMVCVTGIVVGCFAHRVKSRVIVYSGIALLCCGWILTGYAGSPLALQLLFGLIVGIGNGSLYNYTVTTTLKWFPDKKGLVSGINLGCAALGSVFSAPILSLVAERVDPFAAYRVLGCIYAAVLLPVGWMLQNPPQSLLTSVPASETAGEKSLPRRNYTRGEMLKTPDFYILYLIFSFGASSYLMILHSAVPIGQVQAGLSTVLATLSAMLLSVSNFAGRLFFGALSDKTGCYKALLPAMILTTLAMLVMSRVTTPVPYVILMCLVGACGGACMSLFPPIVSERYGVLHSGQNYPLMFSAYSVASLIGPQLAARYEQSGNFQPAFVWAAVIALVAIGLLVWMIVKEKRGPAVKTGTR